MSEDTKREPAELDTELADLADEKSRGFFGEFVDYMLENKKWWLIPIIVALLLIGILIMVGGTAAAPFIYTLF